MYMGLSARSLHLRSTRFCYGRLARLHHAVRRFSLSHAWVKADNGWKWGLQGSPVGVEMVGLVVGGSIRLELRDACGVISQLLIRLIPTC